ncbi:hypothetical protein [Leptospira perdikensis]|uniref:Uncharacterized protein n=1 Tax=Leptospira perdikensis TaxID=2484948 RepID=A0A4R9JLG5_9LEPT|nr:hypothetical protein [Leptospira perdikensis]TGL44964.1 hypothetical protein EHQ49_05760 [Leptospira perdikensis]
MKTRYFISTLIFLSLFMHLTIEWIIPFCETTSAYWYLAKERHYSEKTKVLVFGDSQIVSGVSPSLVAELEGVSLEEVLYLPKPSEQPEGILNESLELIPNLPNLKKIYVNLSPLNTSKNSITDAHKQLFLAFGNFNGNTILHPLLRRAYFSNLTDISWKVIVEIFPYFGISSNINRYVYDKSTQMDLSQRKEEFLSIKQSMEKEKGSWVWKSIGNDPTLNESEEFPNLNTAILAGRRELSMSIWSECLQVWEKQNLDVVFLRIPFSPKMEKDILQTKADVVGEEFLKTVLVGPHRSKVVVLDFKSVFLNEYQYFADLTHLNQKGRDALSSILKKKLFDYTHSSSEGM